MKDDSRVRHFLPWGIAVIGMVCCLLSAVSSNAQSTPPKKSQSASKTAPKKEAPKPVQTKRPPLTPEDILKLWKAKDQDLLMNEVRLRGLSFEPEEDWVFALPDRAGMPLAAAELAKLIPPAPTIDEVSKEAPDLLAKLKEAAQKRSVAELEPLVHPGLMENKAKVYDLFDITNYRNHSLGRFSSQDNRRVGVQFFQLTTSQVERLHYIAFSTSRGKIVVRDIVTGPEVAALFLRDEQQLALSKLDLVFRALNDRDDTGLRNVCTPGMYDSLKELAGEAKGSGSLLTRGPYVSMANVGVKASVPLDQKSIRVVARVTVNSTTGKPLEYDVEFERVANDLKVVRVRDTEGRWIAWDPDVDNYLNRRYNLPDAARPDKDSIPRSDEPPFMPTKDLKLMLVRFLETRNAVRLKETGEEFLQRAAGSGDGYGIRATANSILGNFDEAAKDAMTAIERGGVAYFILLRHTALTLSQPFSNVILAVSREKIEYIPFSGQSGTREDIPTASIDQIRFEKGRTPLTKARPFMNLEFHGPNGKKDYNFAAFGTTCPDQAPPGANATLVNFDGGSICANQPAPSTPGVKLSNPFGKATPLMVPRTWNQDLKVVIDAIQLARTRR